MTQLFSIWRGSTMDYNWIIDLLVGRIPALLWHRRWIFAEWLHLWKCLSINRLGDILGIVCCYSWFFTYLWKCLSMYKLRNVLGTGGFFFLREFVHINELFLFKHWTLNIIYLKIRYRMCKCDIFFPLTICQCLIYVYVNVS